MSIHEYYAAVSLSKEDQPFYALIMAAMTRADTNNAAILQAAYPEVWQELQARWNAAGGHLDGD